MKRTDWTANALCAETDPEIFFPEKGGSTRQAKAVCASCEITETCLTWALEHGERYGIWGGKSERERRKIAIERGITPEYYSHLTEQRLTAVRLANGGLEPLEIAACLEVSLTSVCRWLKDAEVAA